MKVNKYHLRVLSATFLSVIVISFALYTLGIKKDREELNDRHRFLLKADLERTTEHPVVVAFQVQNKGLLERIY